MHRISTSTFEIKDYTIRHLLLYLYNKTNKCLVIEILNIVKAPLKIQMLLV